MSSIGSGGVSSIPDTDEKTKASQGQNSNKRVSGEKARFASSCSFRVPRRSDLSPVKLLKRIGDKVAAALHFVVSRRTRRSSPNASTGKSNPSIAPIDSHRAEAINDCIEFINSSSSLQRSSSVATNSS